MEAFTREADFERALIAALQRQGWKNDRSDQNNSWEDRALLYRPTEEDLLRNWADILYQNNQDVDRLNHVPLLREEMQELIEKIKAQRTPLALNGFINGRTVTITRKNPEDTLHFGKEVSLKIYDRFEIMAGQSVYQIVEQPIFPRHDAVLQDRRGDVMLLINGMPLFHIEFAVGTRICKVQGLFRIHRDKNLHQREEPREDTLVRILFNLMHRLHDRHARTL